MRESLIVHGPPGCGKTHNAVTLARHFGMERIIDDQDPAALPPGIHEATLILTCVDLRGRAYVAGIPVLSYTEAAQQAGVTGRGLPVAAPHG